MSYLQDLGPVAVSHRQEVEQVKQLLGIPHEELDCWVYLFLENKKYNVADTVSKIRRRLAMEINELATYEFTDFMRQSLRKGIIQVIGKDKKGRIAFYVTTRRDTPLPAHRKENRQTFDMMVSYGTRLRTDNKRCQMTMLINQDKASVWSNVDMTFQAEIALRISKFYPGAIDRIYICNMNRALTAIARPIFSRLPSAVSDRMIIMSESDIKRGALLDIYGEDVLPVALGGLNDCDNEENWNRHGEVIENYFTELKKALREGGISVKEWELGLINPLSSSKRGGGLLQRRFSAMWDHYTEPLQTCHSLRNVSFLLNEPTDHGENVSEDADALAWRAIVSPLSIKLAIFFLDELLRWRIATEEAEMEARYALLDRYTEGQNYFVTSSPGVDLEDKKWYQRVPEPLRDICKLFLVFVIVLNAVYFLGALIFFAAFTATIVVTLFLGLFGRWYYIYPLGATIIMASAQGCALCSRCIDILTALSNLKVIPLFENFGTYGGDTAQMILFGILVIIQFIIFCVYALQVSPLAGLQISAATGWLSAVLIVMVAHFLFIFGWVSAPQRVSGGNTMSLTLHMFFDFRTTDEENRDNSNAFHSVRTSTYVICGILVFLNFLFGIGFVISRSVVLSVATCIASLLSAFTVHYCSVAISKTVHGWIFRATHWISCVVWLFVCYTFGFRPYCHQWGIMVIGNLMFVVWLSLFTLLASRQRSNSVITHLAVLQLLVLLLVCCILSFPIIGRNFGLFLLVLVLHTGLTLLLSRHDMTNMGGVFFVIIAILLTGIVCIIIAWFGTTSGTQLPRSTPYNVSNTASPMGFFQLSPKYPVCSINIARGLDIVDLSLLTELGNSPNRSAFLYDMENWFGKTDFLYTGVSETFGSRSHLWYLYKFVSKSKNSTVLVLENEYTFSSMLTMSLWVGSVAMSPLHIFLPTHWTTAILYAISLIYNMIDFESKRMANDLSKYLVDIQRTTKTQLILTSSGLAGGIASVAGIKSKTPTVVFGSPGLIHVLSLVGVKKKDYRDYVLAVGTDNGIIDSLGGHDIIVKQKLGCALSAEKCSSMEYISSELLSRCDLSGRAHVSLV